MSEENVEAVRAGFDAFSRGDMPAFLELADTDVVFTPIPEAPDVEDFHGHEGLLQGLAQVSTEVWDDFSIELREMRDFDDHVLASLRWSGRGPSSGIQVEVDIHALYTFREGKVVRLQFFSSEQQSLEAAGLSE
jgi:ketosteroid isomerase-like protein